MIPISTGMAELVLQRGHRGSVNSVALSPDGSLILTAGADRTAKLWSARDGRVLVTLYGHRDGVTSATFSPDGTLVLTTSEDRTAKVWAAEGGRLVATLTVVGGVDFATFSTDGGQVLAVADYGRKRVWSVEDGRLSDEVVFATKGWIEAGATDRPRILMATGGDNYEVWDVEQERLVSTLKGQGYEVWLAVFDHDARRVAMASKSGAVGVWSVADGSLLAVLEGHSNRLLDAVFSADGTLLHTVSEDGSVRTWDVERGKQLRMHELIADGSLRHARLDPRGELVVTQSSYGDGRPMVWRTGDGRLMSTIQDGSAEQVFMVTGPDAPRIFTASDWGTVKAWDEHYDISVELEGVRSPIVSARLSREGRRLLVTTTGKTGAVRDARDGRLLFWLKAPDDRSIHDERFPSVRRISSLDYVNSANFSADGARIHTTSGFGGDRVWDADNGGLIATLTCGGWSRLRREHIGPDGATVLVGDWLGQDDWQLLRTSDCKPLATMPGRRFAAITTLGSRVPGRLEPRVGPTGERIISAGYSGEDMSLWDTSDGRMVATLQGHSDWVQDVAFSPDGASVFTVSTHELRGWSTDDGRLLLSLDDPHRAMSAVFVSEDGTRLVTTDYEDRTCVRDANTGAMLLALARREGRAEHVSVSSDGHRILVLYGDAGLYAGGEAVLWDARDGRPIIEFDATDARLSADDARILAISDGVAEVRSAEDGRSLASLPSSDGAAAEVVEHELGWYTVIGQTARVTHHRVPLAPTHAFTPASINLEILDAPDGQTRRLFTTHDGLFGGDEEVFDAVSYRIADGTGADLVSADQLFDYFHRPSLIDDFWTGRSLALHPDVADGIGRPPAVELVGVPKSSSVGTIEVRVRAHSRGGGIDRVELFRNRARVTGQGRGVFRAHRPDPERDEVGRLAVEHSFEVELEPGDNRLHAVGYSKIGSVRGEPATEVVHYEAAHQASPELHLLAISLEDYADPSMALGVPHEDARAIVEGFERQQGRLFESVHVTTLRDSDATLEGMIAALDEIEARARVQDVVVLYAAGHAAMVQCRGERAQKYRLLTYRSSLKSKRSLCQEAMSITRLARLLRDVRANKKLLIFDTCQAGGAATSQTLTAMMRGAAQSDALMRIARNEGIAIIAASKDTQVAFEERSVGHGLFTYTLLRGLEGGAAPPDEGIVSVFSLIQYVDRKLPGIAKRYTGKEQWAHYSQQGQDFPLYMIEQGDDPLTTQPPE